MIIPWAEWAPDRSTNDPNVTDAILNVLPKAGSYGPLGALEPISGALPSACRGAVFVRMLDGSVDVFAGTATGLYRLNRTTLDFDDVTQAATTYTLAAGDYWSFLQWGQYLIAVNVNDPPQVIDVESGTEFADLGGSPPHGRYIFSMAGHICIASTAAEPSRFYRSGIEEIDFWTVGQRGCDYQDVPEAGWVLGGVGAQGGAVMFLQGMINELVNLPGDQILFQRVETDKSRGAVSATSIVKAPNGVYFVADDGFYRYGGQQSAPIGAERVDSYFQTDVDRSVITEVQGASDPVNKLVLWRYKSDIASSATSTDKLIIYDWVNDRWSRAAIDMEYLIPAATPGVTLEGLETLGYASIEDVPFSLDSRAWVGDRLTIAAFNTDHKLCFFEGDALEATLETADIALGGEARRAFVNGFRPIGDADGLYGRVAGKDTFGATRTWKAEAAQDVTGLIPARVSARHHRFRVRIPAATDWQHMNGIEVNARAEGRR